LNSEDTHVAEVAVSGLFRSAQGDDINIMTFVAQGFCIPQDTIVILEEGVREMTHPERRTGCAGAA
jgi:putative heme degradation protein